MNYPYTEEGIAECLKETCNTESPVVPGSFELKRSKGVLGGQAEAEYEFKTEDGIKYIMVIRGRDTLGDLMSRSQTYTHVKSIKKV